MATDVLYPPHIPVSALTNRPIEGRLQQSMPNFICAKCQVVLNTPMQAIQHFNGRCQNEVKTIIISMKNIRKRSVIYAIFHILHVKIY